MTQESKCNTMIAGGVWAAAWVSGSCGGAGHIACARALPRSGYPQKRQGSGFFLSRSGVGMDGDRQQKTAARWLRPPLVGGIELILVQPRISPCNVAAGLPRL